MRLHNIQVKAFFKEGDLAEGRILFKQLLPDFEFEEKKVEPESEGGVFTEPLFVLKAAISKQKQAEDFIVKVVSQLTAEEKEEIKNTLELRMDEDCNLYIRLGKKALSEGKIALHTRDPVHIKVKIACFPKSKEKAIKIAKELLGFD